MGRLGQIGLRVAEVSNGRAEGGRLWCGMESTGAEGGVLVHSSEEKMRRATGQGAGRRHCNVPKHGCFPHSFVEYIKSRFLFKYLRVREWGRDHRDCYRNNLQYFKKKSNV